MNTVQNNTVSQSLLSTMNTAKTATASIDAAQDRFMTLLVTQMKNQDPLNPMDNAQMTSQLAQLSTVSGIEKLNDTMQTMINSVQASQAFQAAGMLGRSVMVPGNTLQLTANSSQFAIELPNDVDQLTVSIQDRAGNVVREMTLGPQTAGILPLNWNGYSNNGTSMADGKYFVQVSAKAGGTAATASTLSLDQVSGVTNSTQGVALALKNLGTVSLNQIKQIQN